MLIPCKARIYPVTLTLFLEGMSPCSAAPGAVSACALRVSFADPEFSSVTSAACPNIERTLGPEYRL